MRALLRVAAWLAVMAIIVAAVGLLILQGRGVSSRPEPSGIEKRAALFMRSWLTPSTYKGLKNPVSDTQENFTVAREHFADHCATCHGNDGSGDTAIGKSLYPKAPDMRLPRTQQLSDGEIFYFIENGVRLTGMPAWGNGTPEGERSSWQLVNFIRRLSKLTPADLAEMEKFNPTSRAAIEEEKKVDDFLNGVDPPKPPVDPHATHKKQ